MPAHMWDAGRSSQNPGLRVGVWGSKESGSTQRLRPCGLVSCSAKHDPWYSTRDILRFVVSYFYCRIVKLVPRYPLLVNSLYRTVLGTDHGVPGPDVPWSDWPLE